MKLTNYFKKLATDTPATLFDVYFVLGVGALLTLGIMASIAGLQ